MKKKEILILLVTVGIAIGLWFYFKNSAKKTTSENKIIEVTTAPKEETASPQATEIPETSSTPESDFVSDSGYIVAVQWRNDTVLRFDPFVDATYDIDGDVGGLQVEVKDGKWHVTNEQCPNHVCAQMGWVGVDDVTLPITCLPNNVIIFLEENPSE